MQFAPSQVVLGTPPLTATMGKSEVEFAAALLVRVCHARGDVWAAQSPRDVQDVLGADIASNRDPVARWNGNPFLRPDFRRLVEGGYARWTGEAGSSPLEFTEKGLTALLRWVPGTKAWARDLVGAEIFDVALAAGDGSAGDRLAAFQQTIAPMLRVQPEQMRGRAAAILARVLDLPADAVRRAVDEETP